ncbi:Do family serine endopeptidase [Curvivirga sp.]|uniref:Do family serine endopeptidase n=1 Tax=Curvivirga sp. TaxID=2856848 RepID=UPI003B59889E
MKLHQVLDQQGQVAQSGSIKGNAITALPRGMVMAIFTTLFTVALAASNMAHARGAPDGFADLAERLLPSVVNIKAVQTSVSAEDGQAQGGFQSPFPPGSPFNEFLEQFQNRGGEAPQARPRQSAGSGFIIDSDGIVVTNHHVIDGADEVYVIFNGEREEHRAEVLGADPGADLAVLKIKVDRDLPAVKFGDSDVARIGDWVVAIGNPWGLGGTVTAGIISARSRDIDSQSFVDYIQTDAPINQGNSGGPLFNMDGDVIGINTAIYSRTGGSIGLGFSIPSNQAKKIVQQLQDEGKVSRGWLGVSIQTVDEEIAEGMGLGKTRGALVSSVFDGSPASDAGVQNGDVIIEFNDVDVPDATSLRRAVASTDVGKEVDVVVWRRGKKETLQIELGERNEAQLASLGNSNGNVPESPNQDRLGMALSSLTPENRAEFGVPEDLEGILIKDVKPESDAALKGLRPGVVIVADATGPIKSIKDLDEKIDLAEEYGRETVLLHVWNEGDMRFVPVKIAEK